MAQITYTNKETLNAQPSIADKNKVKADDMNEIKSVVNTNYGEVGDITSLTTTNKTSVVNAINEIVNKISNFTKNTMNPNTAVVNSDNSYYVELGNFIFLSIADLQFKAAVSGTTTILSGAPAPASDVAFLITRMDGKVARLHVGTDGNVKDWYSNIDANTGGSGYWYGFVAYIKA